METLQNLSFSESFGAGTNDLQIANDKNVTSAIIWTVVIVGGTAAIIIITQHQILNRQIEILKKERCRMISDGKENY